MNVECEWASEMEDVPRPLSKVTILVIVAVGIATVILAIIGYRIMDKCEPEKDEARKVVDLSLIEPDYAPDPRIPIIDLYLADYGSPASGTGALWVQAEADTGVSASLMLAVFGKGNPLPMNKECDYIASELYDVMTSLQGQ